MSLRPHRFAAFLALALLAVPLPAAAEPITVAPPLLLDGLSAGGGRVVFAWAGDLWSVPAAGGEAMRLTASATDDLLPAVSPDGTAVAFSRILPGGNFDVFVLPLGADGGPAGEEVRLTWHPKIDWARGWEPDGSAVVFATSREGDHLDRLYRVAADGGFPEPLPVPRGYDGAVDGAGRLAYVPWSIPREFIPWAHYRGGLTSPLRLVADGEDRRIGVEPASDAPEDGVNHLEPAWLGDALYFRADPDGVFDLYALRPGDGNAAERLTTSRGLGVSDLAADASAGRLVFARHGRIFTLDPVTGEEAEVPITIRVERHGRASRSVPLAPAVRSVAFGPDGEWILGARGEIVLAAGGAAYGGTGGTRNLTGTPGVAERDPVPSPDGGRIAAFSDASGEYALEIRSASGGEIERTIPVGSQGGEPTFYRELTWSPDGHRLAFSDIRLALWIADLETGEVREIDRSTYMAQGEWHPRWSPDGRYLTYAKALPNRLRAVFVHDTGADGGRGRSHQVTDGTTHCQYPVFDRSGRYLAFVSSADARLAAASDIGWGLLSTDRAEPLVTRSIHVAVLRAGDRSPFLESSPEVAGTPGDIDLDGLARRIVPYAVPAGIRDWVGLEAGPAGTLIARALSWPATPGFARGVPTPLYRIDLAPLSGDSAPVEILPGVDEYTVSPDGRHLAWSARGRWGVAELGGPGETTPIDPAAGTESFAGVLGDATLEVDPEAEWRQMYREVWRQARDVFYDPGHHGQDLTDLEARYAAYLPGIATRGQLDSLFREMLGRLSVSHLSVRSGDEPDLPPPAAPDPWAEAPPVGVLAIDVSVASGRYRIDRIVRDVHFSHLSPLLNPPLDGPGVDVREGDFVIALDGEEVAAGRNFHSHLEGKTGRPVELTVAASPEGDDRRTVVVTPGAGFGSLREQNWAERAARRVQELSGGRLGYVHVSGWGGSGLDDFYRGLLGHSGKEGLIVDTRFNGGGTTADFAVEALSRAPLYAYAYRWGEPFPVSPVAFPGAKVLLVNRWNFSAGETFPLMWRLAGLGPIVGTRTGGGGIGSALFQRELVDGGSIRIPNRAAFDPAGEWIIENRGVVPDLEVEITPADELAGRDPQIEAAVRLALEAIDAAEAREVVRPEYPVHARPEADSDP
jgi:tricorn protease